MSNYETSASITLEVNGKNAEDRLKALRQRAEDLENALARARNTGDKIEMNKLQKELKKTNKEIREMSSSAQQAESVMRRLDRATPRELSKTLSTLRKQLDNIERGSAAWKLDRGSCFFGHGDSRSLQSPRSLFQKESSSFVIRYCRNRIFVGASGNLPEALFVSFSLSPGVAIFVKN